MPEPGLLGLGAIERRCELGNDLRGRQPVARLAPADVALGEAAAPLEPALGDPALFA